MLMIWLYYWEVEFNNVAAKPVTAGDSVKPPDIFNQGGLGTIDSCVCGDQVNISKPKY